MKKGMILTTGLIFMLVGCGAEESSINSSATEETEAVTQTEQVSTESDSGENADEEVVEQEEDENAAKETQAGKRSDPVAVGETHIVDVSIYDNDFNTYAGKAEITINSIQRGQEVWEYVQGVNQFNEEPVEDHEYLMADVTAKLIEAETEDYAWRLSDMDFSFIGSDGSPYEWTSVVVDPALGGEIYEGGTVEGKVVNMVKKDDPILLVYEDSNWDNIFFATE